MSTTSSELRSGSGLSTWRTPFVIIACGCAIGMLSFGPRSSLGFFIQPMSRDFAWGRDVFGLAIALQNLLWGLGQPLAGAVADRFGTMRVMWGGALLYAGGLLLMRYAATPLSLDLGAGVMIGFGLAGCSFNLVLSAFTKLLPPERRGIALGFGTAAGSFGQFLFAPFGVAMIDNFGWQTALVVFGALMLLILPFSLALSAPPAATSAAPASDQQTFRTALAEAFGHRSYVLLVLGFFTCGFQLAFIATHLPAYLRDKGLQPGDAVAALAVIALANVAGTYAFGLLGARLRRKNVLAGIYLARSAAMALFVLLPLSPATLLMFAATMGFIWLGTLPLTNGIVGQVFGVRHIGSLFGFVFFGHQFGSFLGVWLGGVVFERTHSYDLVWLLAMALGVLAAALHWPIDDRALARTGPLVREHA